MQQRSAFSTLRALSVSPRPVRVAKPPPSAKSSWKTSSKPAHRNGDSALPHQAIQQPYLPSHFAKSILPPSLLSDGETAFRAARYTKRWQGVRFLLFSPRADPARQTRQQKRNKTIDTPASGHGMNSVQILTTPTADTPGTCLLVHFDNRRYMFGNVAEGTQRAFVQTKTSLTRVEHVFMTGTMGWHTAGGLLGTVLTIAETAGAARTQLMQGAKGKKKDAEIPVRNLDIHGGENLTYLLATARRFVFRKGMPIKPHEVRRDTAAATATATTATATTAEAMRRPDWADENMMVWYVPVYAGGENGTAGGGEHGSVSPRKRSHEVMESSGEETGEAEDKAESESQGGSEGRSEDRSEDSVKDGHGTANANSKDSTAAGKQADQKQADRAMLASVVKHMFDSDWKLDALSETTLHKAKLPAKIFVKDSKGHLKVYDGPMPGNRENIEVPDIPVLTRRPWPAALITALPSTTPARQSMCYIMRNHPRRGKVNAAQANRLGVDKRDIKLLVAGQSVTAADGSTVTPDMVIGATTEGSGFAVVELPGREYVDDFLARPEWANASVTAAINTMFWILGGGVASDPRVQAFMRAHGSIRHIAASSEACANRLALSSAAALQVQHNRVDPDRFWIQQYSNLPELATDVATDTASAAAEAPFVAARPGWAVRLAPQVLEEDGKVYSFVDFGAAIDSMDPAVLELADAARQNTTTPAFQQAAAASNRGLSALAVATEVIPLGTGSAMPSKYRNVSATLVRVPGVGSYLFDCGENTLGSMRRLFGAEKLAEVLRDLRAIWISHLHADHHLGTVSVIRAWRDATAEAVSGATETAALPRLMVASHIDMLRFLREYSAMEEFGLDRVYQVSVECPNYPKSKVCTPVSFPPARQAEFGLREIEAARVDHCHGAMAVSLVFAQQGTASPEEKDAEPEPLKISYSGDCRPSQDFVKIGKKSTLLIHESTFDDELAGDALAKKHSTMGEALSVAEKMGARRVLLTHFSQRYPKIPVFSGGDDAGENSSGGPKMEVLVAFDQMSVKLGDFHTAAAYLPALQKLYEDDTAAAVARESGK